jgi:hypothetical protein
MAVQEILNTNPNATERMYGAADLGMNALVVPNGSRSVESAIINMMDVEQFTLDINCTIASDVYITIYDELGVTALGAIKVATLTAGQIATISVGTEMTIGVSNATQVPAGQGLRLPQRAISFSVQGTAASGTVTARLFTRLVAA